MERARLELSPIGLMTASGMDPDEWQSGFLASGSSMNGSGDIYVLTSRQAGKALAVDTPVPTPSGWTAMGDLAEGDVVYDERGEHAKVIVAHPVAITDCWRVTFSDGSHLDASGSHLWTVLGLTARQRMRERHPGGPPPDWASWSLPSQRWAGGPRRLSGPETLSTDRLRERGLRRGRECRWVIPVAAPLAELEVDLPVDPWCLGYWLGNGSTGSGSAIANIDDAEAAVARFVAAGFGCRTVACEDRHASWLRVTGLYRRLREAGVLDRKRVPPEYLRASASQRLALLRGLMDADGSGDYRAVRSNCEFSSTNPDIAEAFVELATSLGFKPVVAERRAMLNGEDYGPYWRIGFTPAVNPFALPRKAASWTDNKAAGARPFGRSTRSIESIERLPDQPTRCITVSSDSGLFLAGRAMIPTHNSTASAALAAWSAWQRPKLLTLIVSPTLRQSSELGQKVRSFLPLLPVRADAESKLSVTLSNGSRIECLPGRPETVRGYSPDLIIADEAAWIADELYEALSPARARTGGRLIALSTPGAPEGWFYTGWSSDELGAIERVRVPWTAVSGLSAAVVEAERALMPAARWRAEFECEFLRPAGQVFDTSRLESMVSDELPDWERVPVAA